MFGENKKFLKFAEGDKIKYVPSIDSSTLTKDDSTKFFKSVGRDIIKNQKMEFPPIPVIDKDLEELYKNSLEGLKTKIKEYEDDTYFRPFSLESLGARILLPPVAYTSWFQFFSEYGPVDFLNHEAMNSLPLEYQIALPFTVLFGLIEPSVELSIRKKVRKYKAKKLDKLINALNIIEIK